MNAFLIAAPRSGDGKTTLTLALLKALSKRRDVKAFKAGPDYIDPMYHTSVLKIPSYNLDLRICNEEEVKNCFCKNAGSISIVEGVMGMFDGYEHGFGSSAHLAQVLDIPVLFILDGRALSTSAAAIVKGFSEFELFGRKTPICGIILNRIKSESTFRLLKKEIEFFTNIPVLGYFPEDTSLFLPSRHLGLVEPQEIQAFSQVIEYAADIATQYIDLDKLLEVTEVQLPVGSSKIKHKQNLFRGIKIAIARDRAFNFYYQENLDILEEFGLELVFFSPLEDSRLPECDILYLGGGYPELYLKELEANVTLRSDIYKKLTEGLYCYAECGGLIYLSESIKFEEKSYSGVGYFKNTIEMTAGLQNFGYCKIEINGIKAWAHEFHRTKLKVREKCSFAYKLTKKGYSWLDGQIKGNTIAGYPHLYFGSDGSRALLLCFLEKVRKGESLENDVHTTKGKTDET